MIESDFTSSGLEDPESPCQDRVSLEPGPKSTGHPASRKGFLSKTIPITPHNHSHALYRSGQDHALRLTKDSLKNIYSPVSSFPRPLDVARLHDDPVPEEKTSKETERLTTNPPTPFTPHNKPPYPFTPYPILLYPLTTITITMATQPKIALLPPAPSISKTYSPTLRSCIQQTSPPSSTLPPTPQTFLDAMTVREAVFVDEQKVALENEFDEEDPRCWHWVLYASEEPESEPKPAGTIRLVPFPQLGEEPRAGGVYFGGELVNAGELGGEFPFSDP